RDVLASHQRFDKNSHLLSQLPPPAPSQGPAPPKPVWPQPGEILGDLTLWRELGRGAFSRVYLASEASTGDRPVAVKLTCYRSAEARPQGGLAPPHVVPILSARSQVLPLLDLVCMPFLGSATLRDVQDRLYSSRCAPAPRAGRDILDAVAALSRPGDPLPDR